TCALPILLYVLDKPSRGMHPSDTDRLFRVLEGLRDRGSTVLLVEHDLDLIRRADHVIDLNDGRIVAEGTPSELAKNKASVTGPWLAGKELPRVQRAETDDRVHDIPRAAITCVVGPSGAGKTRLVFETLIPLLTPEFERVIAVDASPLGRS